MDVLYRIFSSSSQNEINSRQEITFYLHDKIQNVKISDFTATTTLNEYIRDSLHLKGTKVMCREGGCGVCIVAATVPHPVTKKEVTFTVNSCLVSLFSCHNWKIATVEGVSVQNSQKPDVPIYHKAQDALVKFSGTQCGFCSSGMIMTMQTMLKENPKVTMKEIENSFGGNICRCTGYRPILAAFKSLASDADKTLIGDYPDIEDTQVECPLNKDECKNACASPCQIDKKVSFCLDYGEGKWYKVYELSELAQLFKSSPQSTYMLISGNTAKGVFPNPPAKDLYVDITGVQQLYSYTLKNDLLELGANMPLTEVMALFYSLGSEKPEFSYLTKMADHMDLIATVPIRNIGSLAGNLSIKHDHHEFPSDVFLILETAGATLTIVNQDLAETTMSIADYVNIDMNHKIISKITLKSYDDNYKYESYKIMPRAQNAHALVNAGFLFQFDNNKHISSARIVYGCINPSFVHATNTENFLVGKNIFDNAVLQEVFAKLDEELKPDHVLPDPTPEFRKKLATSLLFKCVLSMAPDGQINVRNKSGAQKLTRPLSSGTQDYDTNESLYPLTQPIAKVEAYAQVSGHAEYIMDMPDRPGQLYSALVLAKAKPYSTITSIDKEDALELPGVVAFYDKSDIPGKNSFTAFFPAPEELFCDGTVKYYNQPVGIVVANSQAIAEKGADLIKINYTSSGTTPIFTTREVLKRNDTSRLTPGDVVKPTRKGNNVKHVIQGSFDCGLQYHYHMETQCCSVIPIEDGLDVFPATQWMDLVQAAIAENLNMDANKINIKVRRLGGAYGAKISRNGQFTCAAALAAYKLQKPVKYWSPFPTNMDVVGKRCPLTADYEVGLDDKGVVQYLNVTLYSDSGSIVGNEGMLGEVVRLLKSGYLTDTYQITPYSVKTDMHTNTWCRAPGTTEGLALIESIFEHISYAINVDPFQIRLANIDQNEHPKLYKFCNDLLEWADINGRKMEIKTFNKDNRWRKKGMAVVPMAYGYHPFGNYSVFISIYQADGTVAISHGGVEMGQGINTKVIQVTAHALGIPVDKVCVKPSNNLISPNTLPTGGSVTSESVCFAALKAIDILNARMAPIKAKLNNPTWLEVVKKCHVEDIALNALYKFNAKEVSTYDIYAVCATEVEVDILTGLYQLTRVDLLEDTGESMSPLVDIGQVEGAFIMGQGFWTTEEIIIGEEGQILTNRTWTYKPPGPKDIPIDFRVKFPKNNPNPASILNSKATAEPPLCVTCCVPLSIRNAVASARAETGTGVDQWYPMNGPSTVENTYLNSLHNYNQYTL